MPDLRLVVIGAGIIGASTALALQRDGHRVTLIDREAPCAGASFGNAGAIVNASCTPSAMPGITIDALRMLCQPLSPLSIRPSYLYKILPWLIRFALESRRSRVTENARHLCALTKRSIAAWRELTIGTSLSALLREGGWLTVYESDRSFARSADSRALKDANDAHYEILSAADIRDLEPDLAPIFKHGIFSRESLWLSNPQRMVQGMVELLLSRGGTYRQFDVQSIDIDDQQIVLRNDSATLLADKLIIATGAWSKRLAKQCGDNVPLDTERGYHIMLASENSRLLSRPVMNAESSFALVPMKSGLRLTGQDELAGIDAAPDYRRIRRLLPEARRMLPAIQGHEESVWMGCRPSLPDSLPVIGFATRSKDVLYAFGHQHLGMTLGPATGLMIADLIAGRNDAVDLTLYGAERFTSVRAMLRSVCR